MLLSLCAPGMAFSTGVNVEPPPPGSPHAPGVKLGSMRFDPPELEFFDELTCVPHHSQVRIYCDGCHAIISVDSVTSDMDAVYPALVPKNGKQTKKKGKSPAIGIMHVMFLATQPGEVRGRISVKTSAGLVHYPVQGYSAPNPYKAEAIHNLKVGAGEILHHPLSIFNPWKEPLQISQVSTNESFIQLLAPDELSQIGHKSSPTGSDSILAELAGSDWTIPPEEQRVVGYAKFALQQGHYQGFVEMKMDSDVPRIVVPVTLGVVRSSGIKISPDIVDFQTLVSSIQARSIWLSVTNLNRQPIQLLSLFDPTQNPNLQISGFDHKKGISVASGSQVRFAKVTYHGSREGQVQGKLQLIVNDTDAVSATMDVPYKANVLYGSLGFMNDKTKFLSTPGRVTSTMRAIMVSNNFSVPIQIKSAKIEDPSFKISHFQADIVLQPGEATSLMHLEYTSNGTSILCTRDLELATNVTAMKIPLQVYHGKLHCQVEHGEVQECGMAASSLDLDMGLLSVSEVRRSRINISNPNPVNVTIESFSFSHPSISLHMDGIYTPEGQQVRSSRPIPRQSHTKKVLTLQAGHRLALALEVLAQEPTTASAPPVNASVTLVTKRGEKIVLRMRYESVLGSLSFSPASLRFEASFPGQVQSRVVAARSTFEQPLQLNAVRSTDSRITPELLTKTLKPLARTEVVRVYYDPAKAASLGPPHGAASAEDASRGALAASVSGEAVSWNHPLTLDFLEKWMARQKSVTNSNGRGTSEIEATLIFDTNIVAGATLTVQASLMQAHSLFEPLLSFDLTQVGASKTRWLLVQNPSESPLALQLVFPVCSATKSRGSGDNHTQTSTTSLAQEGSSLAADCAGGRAFRLGAESDGKVWHVEPLGEASVGPIIFEPFQHAQYRTTLYVRNNLTTLHQVELVGHGGSSRLVFPEGVLEFNLTTADFGAEEDVGAFQSFGGLAAARRNQSDSNFSDAVGSDPAWLSWLTASNGSHGGGFGSDADGMGSQPSWWRQHRRVAVTRSLMATNDCELPVEVAEVNIGGVPGCSAFGFEVLDCRLPFTVAPHESVAVSVSFTPEVVASRWARNLRFLSSSGRPVLQVPLRVNLSPELLPMLSDLPTSLQILGDQTEASLRRAVVGTAFAVLILMLVVVAMDGFRALRSPSAGQLHSKLFNGAGSTDTYTSTAARVGDVVSMLSWTSVDAFAGVEDKEPVQRVQLQDEPSAAQAPQAASQRAPQPEVSQQDQLKEQQQQLQAQLQQLQQLQAQHLGRAEAREASGSQDTAAAPPKAAAKASQSQAKAHTTQAQTPKNQQQSAAPAQAKQPAKQKEGKGPKESASAPPSAPPKSSAPSNQSPPPKASPAPAAPAAPAATANSDKRPSQPQGAKTEEPKPKKKAEKHETDQSPHQAKVPQPPTQAPPAPAQAQAIAARRREEERAEERRREEETRRENQKRAQEEAAKKKEKEKDREKEKELKEHKDSKARRSEQQERASATKAPPSQPPTVPPAPAKAPSQAQPSQLPTQPPTLPPAAPPMQTQPVPQTPVPLNSVNSVWMDNKSPSDFMSQPSGMLQEESSSMPLPPPPSIPPPPAPSKAAPIKPKAISPMSTAPAQDMGERGAVRAPPGIDLGLLLTGPAPGLSPQPVRPPPGIANPYAPDPGSLAPAEAAAVSAVQGLGTDSFFGTPGLDFGNLGAIGLPPGIAPGMPGPKQPQRLQQPGSSSGMQDFFDSSLDRLGMFNEPGANSSLFSSPFGMFGPIGGYGERTSSDGNDFLSDLRSDSRRMDG